MQNAKLTIDSKNNAAAHKGVSLETPRYEQALFGLQIVYTDIARNSLSLLPLSEQQFMDLLSIEFKSHPLFSQIDYESLPLPLKNGYFAVLTKANDKVTLETINKSGIKKKLFDTWSKMARLYFQAYRLPFRSNHNILIQEKEFQRTLKLLDELIVAAQAYIYQTQVADDTNVRIACHELKQRASKARMSAEFLYLKYTRTNDSSILGSIAIQLDLIVSAIHKILVEYNVPK